MLLPPAGGDLFWGKRGYTYPLGPGSLGIWAILGVGRGERMGVWWF